MTGSDPGTSKVSYRLTGYSGNETEARIELRAFVAPVRARRATVGLATWWAAALVSVFIPVAHFVLVPGFAVFGLVVFVQRLRTDAIVVAAHGTCPDCGAEQDLDMLGRWREGGGVACRDCHRALRLLPT